MGVVSPRGVSILLGRRVKNVLFCLVNTFVKRSYLAVLHIQLKRLIIGGQGRVVRHVRVQSNFEVESDLTVREVDWIRSLYIDIKICGGS